MTIMTKWFGRKVKGEALDNLVSALGEDPNKLLHADAEKSSTVNTYGRVNILPVKEGFNVDLYVFREDLSVKDDSTEQDKVPFFSFPNIFSEGNIQAYEEHLQGRVNY